MVAELTVTDGMPPPADLPAGECIITTLYDDDDQPSGVCVLRADPRVLISAQVLDAAITTGPDAWPWSASLDTSGCFRPEPGKNWTTTYVGAVLKIHGANRTVIYRITGYVPAVHAYIGEWPD